MRFVGTALFELSRELPNEARRAVEEIVDFLNRDYLKRGCGKDPSQGAEVKNWRIEGKNLWMEFVCGKRVRIDDAVLRTRKVLSERLGKEFRIGVRGVKLVDCAIELDNEVRVSLRLPFIKEVVSEGGRTLVKLGGLELSDLKKPVFVRLLRLIEEKEARTKWGGKAEHWQLIKQSRRKRLTPPPEDPNKILEEAGWIRRMSIGQYLYTPPFTRILNAMKRVFIEEVVKPLGFVEAVFPKMYPLQVGLKTGHLKGVINSMLFACLPKSYNIEEFEELIDYMYVMEDLPPEELQKYLRPPSYFLCFAQCEPFYWFFENEVLDDDSLPIKWFDASGPSFRWEAGGLHGVERVIEFHRVEVVWLGKPEQVVKIRNELLERYEKLMDEVLDLEWRWAWVTPWFYEQSGESSAELGLDIDRPGTIDFEAYLPHRGPREDRKSWLEIGNISIHGTKFTEPFRIKHNKGETLWTGCSGFGSERWVIAFLAQHGFNPKDWPSGFLKYFESEPMPKSVRAVTYPKTQRGRELLRMLEEMFRDYSS